MKSVNGIFARRREVARIERLLVRLHHPRLQMMLIVALTGAVGFLSSYFLLHTGLDSLWIRYLFAFAVAYIAFLLFLWCWLRVRTGDILDGVDFPSGSSGSGSAPDKQFEAGGGHFGGGGASSSFDSHGNTSIDASSSSDLGVADATSGLDMDIGEAAVVVLAIVAVAIAGWVAISIVWSAPELFAELLLDVGLASGLYRRLKNIDTDHWLNSAIRKTALPFALAALAFVIAGAVMQAKVPSAKSIGEVVQHYKVR